MSDRARPFTMPPVQAALFDVLYDNGLPATLDGLAAVCREHAKWCREDREPKNARAWDRAADGLHKLSLALASNSP